MLPMMRPYRGPQKIGGPTIAVFIDVDNTNMSRDNFLEVFSLLRTQGVVTYGKLYGYRGGKDLEFDEIIAEYRLETVGLMRFKFNEASVVDPRLVIDAMAAADSRRYDAIFVWAGVGDLMNLFAHIKQRGRRVITVDLPAFDTTNKFIDSKIKLFSAHSLQRQSSADTGSSMPASHNKTPASQSAKNKVPEHDLGDLEDENFNGSDLKTDITESDLSDLGDEIEDLDLDELKGLDASDFDDLDSIADLEEEKEAAEDDLGDFADIKEGLDPGEQVTNNTPTNANSDVEDELNEEEREELMKALAELNSGDGAESSVGTMDIGNVGAAQRNSDNKSMYGSIGFDYHMEQQDPIDDKVKPSSDDFDDFGNL